MCDCTTCDIHNHNTIRFCIQVGEDFKTGLLNVNLTAVDKATQKEVEMFLIAIHKNPPTMNLDGYADINRGLITSVSSKKFPSSRHYPVIFISDDFACFHLVNRTYRLWQLI